jgi:hypothetical protein
VLSEIPVDFEPRAEAALRAALAQSRLMLLGEVHGVEENPAVIYTLFRRFEFAALALEWPSSIDLRNPMLSADGRITPRHFELWDQPGEDATRASISRMASSRSRYQTPMPPEWAERDSLFVCPALAVIV